MNRRNNNNNNQLTYRQFKQKHAAKYQGLPDNQIRERYNQYLATLNVSRAVVVAPRKPVLRTPGVTRANANRRRGPLNPRPKQTQVSISDCTLKYAIASIDPFDQNLTEVCIPDSLCAPSYKFDVLCKGTMKVGEQGIGFVVFNPWTMATNNNAINVDGVDYPILFTDDNYTYDDIEVTYASIITDNMVHGANSNSFFTTDSFRPTNGIFPTLRLVAAGLELMYSGPLMDQAGTINTLQNDGLEPIFSPMTVIQVKNNPKTRTCANAKDQRCYQSYYPTSQEFLSYNKITEFMPSQLNADAPVAPFNNHPILILVDGATPSTSFAFEARAFFEVLMPGMKASPSESDPIGFPAFQAARTLLKNNTGDPRADVRSTLFDTIKNIGTTISGYAPAIGTAIGAAFGNPIAGGAIGTAAQGLLNSLLGNSPSPY